MDKTQIIAEINEMIDVIGIDNPASIAFAIIQKDAELKGNGDSFAEAMTLRDNFIRIQNAFEEEYKILNGGEGPTYTAN